jgi:alpha-tubulin suppressor-like RCC1 family protein
VRGLFRQLGIGALVALPILACNAIVGVEDVKLRDQKSSNTQGNDDDGNDDDTDEPPINGGDGDAGDTEPTCTGTCATAISLGRAFACALATDGKVRCWGDNAKGQTGQAGAAMTMKPTLVPGLEKVRQISTGSDHACALVEGGKVFCWGDNADGIVTGVADTAVTPRPTPTEVTGFPVTPRSIAGISAHQCAVLTNDELFCWGYNASGQCGVAPGTSRRVLKPTKALAGVKLVGGAEEVTCAVLGDGKVSCFGRNLSGQLGRNTSDTEPHPDPQVVTGLTPKAIAIRPGTGFHVSVVLDGGKVAGWGSNARGGVLGETTPAQLILPKVLDQPTGVVEVAPGGYFSCARLTDGTISCWGDSTDGQSGPTGDAGTGQAAPTPIAKIQGAEAIAAGRVGFACAVARGKVLCWGANERGQLGRGASGASSATPEEIALP